MQDPKVPSYALILEDEYFSHTLSELQFAEQKSKMRMVRRRVQCHQEQKAHRKQSRGVKEEQKIKQQAISASLNPIST